MDRRMLAVPLLALIFGSNFMFVKIAAEEVSPFQMVTLRLVIAAGLVAVIVRWRGTTIQWSAPLVARTSFVAVTGTIVPFVLIAWASSRIDSGLASVLNSSMPLFTALFAVIAADESVTPQRAAGLLIGFAGVAAMTGIAALDVSGEALAGQLAVVTAAAAFSVSAVYARRLLRAHDGIELAGGQLAIAAVLSSVLFAGLRGAPDYTLSADTWVAIAFMGAVSGGLGFATYIWLIGQIGSVRASTITYLMPVVALGLGWLVLGESIAPQTIAGMALIIAGVAIVMRAPAIRAPARPVRAEATGC